MRIIFIGTVEFSQKALRELIELRANIVGVLTKEKSKINSDFADLSNTCKQHQIHYRYTKDINMVENIEWIKSLKPDILFCFGFSQILKEEILSVAPMGVVGFHPAKLPQNRGRHPLIWALALGLKRTGSTFFFMDSGADSGDILSQQEIDIDYHDNARSLYDKVTNTAIRQIKEFLPKLQDGSFHRTPQDHSKANYWRKREKGDGKIDFRMNSRGIHNLVRALTKPYVGAHLLHNGKEIKVWAAKESELTQDNIEYGKVLDISRGEILVKCQNRGVSLVKHEFEELPKVGEYLL